MRWVVVLAACTHGTPEPLHNKTTTTSPLVAIENVPPLPFSKYELAAQDCRPSEVIRRRFAGKTVTACGTLGADASKPALEAARACVAKAVADSQPFIHEVQLQGIDSEVARALVGVIEGTELATYRIDYDSDPCGGSCPQRGLTTVERCVHIVRDPTHEDGCAYDVTQCYRCERSHVVELCRFGERGK